VATQFDFAIREQVERLIVAGGAEPPQKFSGGSAANVAIAALIVATVSMTCNVINTVRQSGAQPAPAAIEREVVLKIVPPQGISEQTLTKVVHAAVAEAMKSHK